MLCVNFIYHTYTYLKKVEFRNYDNAKLIVVFETKNIYFIQGTYCFIIVKI